MEQLLRVNTYLMLRPREMVWMWSKAYPCRVGDALVIFNSQLDIIQSHLREALVEVLHLPVWPVVLSMRDCLD